MSAMVANPTAAGRDTFSIASNTRADSSVATGIRQLGLPVWSHSLLNETVPTRRMIPVDAAILFVFLFLVIIDQMVIESLG